MSHQLSDYDRETLEPAGRCGYAVVDADGIEEPCDRPATGWRWYQDVNHEDALDVACERHENEGGRRMASLTSDLTAAVVARDKAEARIEAARAYVDHPGNWSSQDGRRRMILALLDGSAVTRGGSGPVPA